MKKFFFIRLNNGANFVLHQTNAWDRVGAVKEIRGLYPDLPLNDDGYHKTDKINGWHFTYCVAEGL